MSDNGGTAVSVREASGEQRSPRGGQPEPLGHHLVPSEGEFYQNYGWTLNAYPTIAEVLDYLRAEIPRMESYGPGWQLTEAMTNVFLLACALTNAVDDFLMGPGYDFSKVGAVRAAGPAIRLAGYALKAWRRVRESRLGWLVTWRDRWEAAVNEYVELFVLGGAPDRDARSRCGRRMNSVLGVRMPADLRRRRLRNPAFFHVRDLTHLDILTLGRKLVAKFPDRGMPILITGTRTAGSYFAPLLRAYLKNEGYRSIDVVTMRPKNGLSGWERRRLAGSARQGGLGVIVDEPAMTGSTLLKVAAILVKAGVPQANVVALNPVHPTTRDWRSAPECLPLAKLCILSLEPEEWHKYHLLEADAVAGVLGEYFQGRGYVSTAVVSSARAEELNAQLQALSEEKWHTRLKRIYEVRLEDRAGRSETRFVLAKSTGWGWLSYHAFIAGRHLATHVPAVLGLRNGLLFTEWRLPAESVAQQPRDLTVNTLASYVAARVRSLGLGTDPTAELNRDKQHEGVEELAGLLSGAYGSKAAALKRCRVRAELTRHPCPRPTLVDGKMRRQEWVAGTSSYVKTDFEHHGAGKRELNVVDPAYDLADAVLQFRLSPSEERALITRYIEESGDTTVEQRLFLNKLLAGARSRSLALQNLKDARLSRRAQEFNQQYNDARDFLTIQTMRFCAGVSHRPDTPRWRSPLVVMDIDGVLDRQVFGFPSTSAAGIQAVSLLHAHDFATAVDTARSMSEVKEYCLAYGFAGGVAEYGSCLWDAVHGQERLLVSPDSLSQLDRLRDALRDIAGVFLNDAYRHSIRAYTYRGESTVALPGLLIQNLLARLKLDRLRFHQTDLDTAVLAKEVDKGAGLVALTAWVGGREFETLAIGDSEPDLAMFAVATRSFAPSHISCRRVAGALGCRIADRAFQPGLLNSVRSIVHPDGKSCERCRRCDFPDPRPTDLMLQLLKVADERQGRRLLRAVLDPMAVRTFEL